MSLKSKLPRPSHLHRPRRAPVVHSQATTIPARWPPSSQALLCSKPSEVVDKVRKATGWRHIKGVFDGEEAREMYVWMSLLLICHFDFWQVPKWKDLVVSWRFGTGSGVDAGKTHSKKLLMLSTHCYLIISFQRLQTSLQIKLLSQNYFHKTGNKDFW